MVGYAEGQKAYQLWVPTQWKIILAESVYFDEDSLLHDRTDDSLPLMDLFTDKRPSTPNKDTHPPDPPSTGNKDTVVDIPSPIPSSPITPSNPPLFSDRPQHTRKEPAWHQLNSSEEAFRKAAELPPLSCKSTDTTKDFTYYINLAEHIIKEEHTHFAYSAVTLNTEVELKSYEAIHSPQSEEWLEAIEDEKNSLIALGVFETIKCSDIPKDCKLVGSKMVFKVKQNEKGNVTCYKVWIIAKGYSQVPGVDFFDTYAPVTHLTSVRILLAIANACGLKLEQLDVKMAYLYGDLNETIYMVPPEGINTSSDDIWVLKKSLYGLKQSGKAWNDKIHNILTTMGFYCCASDQCVYTYNTNDIYCALALYVDDILLACNSIDFLNKLKADLKSNFDIIKLGPAKFLLGIEIEQNCNQHTISISQCRYIDKMLDCFGMMDANPSFTPMASKVRLSAGTPAEHEDAKELPYQSLTGSLLYAAMATHLDIAYAIAQLCKYNSSYMQTHWIATKQVLCYLKGTRDLCLTYD